MTNYTKFPMTLYVCLKQNNSLLVRYILLGKWYERFHHRVADTSREIGSSVVDREGETHLFTGRFTALAGVP